MLHQLYVNKKYTYIANEKYNPALNPLDHL